MGKPSGPPPKLAELRAKEAAGQKNSAVSHRPIPPVIELAPRVNSLDMAKPPKDLPSEARELWEQVMPWLVDANVIQLVDLPAVRSMCIHYAQMERARRVLDEDGYFVLGSQGQMVEHPSMRIFNNASDKFLKYAQEFGLTTVARTRMGLMDIQRQSIQSEMNWTLGPGTRRSEG